MVEMNDTDLAERVKNTDSYFKWLIDMVPPEQYGFSDDVKELMKEEKHRLVDSKLTEGVRERLSKKAKQKYARLDPVQLKTVSQIQEFVAETEAMAKVTDKQKKPLLQGKPQQSLPEATHSGATAEHLTREELMQKLQKKVDEHRTKRGAQTSASWIENIRNKRRISKMKLKERRKAEKRSLRVANGGPDDSSEPTNGKRKNPDSQQVSSKKARVKKEEVDEAVGNGTDLKPIYNSQGKLVFSKFDFAVSGAATDKPNGNKKNKRKPKGPIDISSTKLKGKDFKKLLTAVEQRDAKLQQLAQVDEQKAMNLKQKIHFESAIQRAAGVKVKDDPVLLKRSLKKQEKKKAQSSKKWEQRNEQVQHRQEKHQAKRKENLQIRKQKKVGKAVEKAKKRGRLVPGF